MEEGWIKLHRSISNHWIFKDAEKLKAWLTIIITVNHNDNKVNLGDTITLCKRGESVNSLDTWVKIFGKNWNKSKVRRFLKLLESDLMIELIPNTKTTHIRVCKYDDYQSRRNVNETGLKHKRNASETDLTPNKNVKKEKNDNNEKNIYKKFAHLSISIIEFEKIKESGYSKDQIDNVLLSIQNYRKNTNYSSLYLTCLKWLKKDNPTQENSQEKRYSYKIHFTGYDNRTEKQYQEDLARYGDNLKLR